VINPFEKRATEYIRDNESFLSIVSPEPLTSFLKGFASKGILYDRLVRIVGAPGSGKTTIAKLFQFEVIDAALKSAGLETHKPIIDALTSCGAIKNSRAILLGYRLPLGSEYRAIWELPYPEDIRAGLLRSIIQARTILGWFGQLRPISNLENISIVPKAGAEGRLEFIGGRNVEQIVSRARQIEKSVYAITSALVPPKVDKIPSDAIVAYGPFDVIEQILVESDDGEARSLLPLVMLDDAHSLHEDQFKSVCQWLGDREVKVARWLLMRYDALSVREAITVHTSASKNSRDMTTVTMQKSSERFQERKKFRKMAKDMANRALSKLTVFHSRHINDFAGLLSTDIPTLSLQQIESLKNKIDKMQRKLGISDERKVALLKLIDGYNKDFSDDERYSTLAILLNRYAKRVPNRSLFEDVEPSRPIKMSQGVCEGAKIHMLHEFNRPTYYGVDTLCDASTENAEQFLHLAAALVDAIETRIIQRKRHSLDAAMQNRLLRTRAGQLIDQWAFPGSVAVRKLVERIAATCTKVSLAPNAWLDGGANAIGIPQEEFNALSDTYPDLARVVQAGVAYNAFSLVPGYKTKNREWCLIELGGLCILHYGLTLNRGGFIESTTRSLNDMVNEEV